MKRAVYTFALRLAQTTESLAAMLVAVAVATNIAQVFYRRILNSPLEWSEEVMRYTMIWVALLAASAGIFRGEHMAAGVLGRMRNRLLATALRYTILIVIGAFGFVLAYWGGRYALNTGQYSPAAQISMNYPYAAVGVGGILMLIQVICLSLLPENALPHSSDVKPEDLI